MPFDRVLTVMLTDYLLLCLDTDRELLVLMLEGGKTLTEPFNFSLSDEGSRDLPHHYTTHAYGAAGDGGGSYW